jgi:branched-chain amino acid transport system substrate-binding protein
MHVVQDSSVIGFVVRLVFLLLVSITPACAVLQTTRPVVKIGLVAPFEGEYRYIGYDAIYAVRLALREANASGGVGGYTVELVAYDDRGMPSEARTAARNLGLDSQVVSVIGHFLDETTEVARPIYVENGLPLADVGATQNDPDIYHALLLCPLLEYAISVHPERARNDSVMVQWISTDRNAKLKCNHEIILSVGQALNLSSDIVLLTIDPVVAGETVKAMREAGFGGLVVGGPTLGSSLFGAVAGVAAADVIFVSPYRRPDLEGRDDAFAEMYQSMGPHVPPPGPFALESYYLSNEILNAIETASKKAGKPTRETVGHQLPQLGSTAVYLYNWTLTGSIQLVKEFAREPR